MRFFPSRSYGPTHKWVLWRWEDLFHEDGTPYLTRLVLFKTPLFSLYLHWIKDRDPDRDVHDHPWPFASLVLRGSYIEEDWKVRRSLGVLKLCSRRIRTILWFNFKTRAHAHRITWASPRTITLVFIGPKLGSWGFYQRLPERPKLRFIPWRQYEVA